MEEQLQKIVEELTRNLLEVKEELESTKRTVLEVKEEHDSTKKRLSKVEWEFDRLLNELEPAKPSYSTRLNRNEASSSRRSMKLVLRNGISSTILPGEEIKGEDDASIEVALVDASTGDIVHVEKESSSNVEIVLIKGEFDVDDWTTESFQQNIVQGEKPLLAGKVRVKLHKGVGVLHSIKLRHGTRKITPSKFRLGARVVDTFDRERVKEAITHSFTVKDFRNKYTKKHKTPSLSDQVWRLIYIRKRGPIHKRLTSKKICTVEDFLIRLLINPKGLNCIVNLMGKKWEALVNNARACPDHKRMYCYINSQKTMGVVFNVLGILGLYLETQYFSTNKLSENHKADAQELLESAYKHWEAAVVFFDDDDSLQQHLKKSLGQHLSSELPGPYYPLVSHDNLYGCDGYETAPANIMADTTTLNHDGESSNGNFSFHSLLSAMNSAGDEDLGSEMKSESINAHSNSSFQSLISAINSIREEGLGSEMIGESSNGDSNSSFQSLISNMNSSTEEENLGSYFDARMQLCPPPTFDMETYLLGLQDSLYQNDNVEYMWNADEETNTSPFAYVEYRGDDIGKGSKMWKTIYKRMKMVFSIGKLVPVRGN